MTWTQFIAKQKAKMQAEDSATETDVSDSEWSLFVLHFHWISGCVFTAFVCVLTTWSQRFLFTETVFWQHLNDILTAFNYCTFWDSILEQICTTFELHF
jgi:hypothetical protein